MGAGKLQVEVVSREGRLWHGVCRHIQIPAHDGALGVLPGHQPLLAMLSAGTVELDAEDGRHSFTVDRGFASVDSDYVTIVAEHGHEL